MSQSSLPDIFRKASKQEILLRKQGASFSLHLSVQTAEKYTPSRAGYAPGDQNYLTLQANKPRSASTNSVRSKPSLLNLGNVKKQNSSRSNINQNSQFQLQFLTNSPPKYQKVLSVFNISNFPYQTTRRMNNMTIDLQQSNSLKNKIQFNLKEMKTISDSLHQAKEIADQIREQFNTVKSKIVQEMEEFEEEFEQKLKECYQSMSRLRRETGEQQKGNKIQLEKVSNDVSTCTHFANDIDRISQKMYQHCLSTPKLPKQTSYRTVSPSIDFEDISSIQKTSRGATGDLSRRTKITDLLRNNKVKRLSPDEKLIAVQPGRMTINGKQVQLLSFQEC